MTPCRRVAVLGLGITGYESALFLCRKGFEVTVYETREDATQKEKSAELEKNKIRVRWGSEVQENIQDVDWILTSPGIAPTSPVLSSASKRSIPIYSEIEVASWFSQTSNIIAVTGTCGKTTLTTLLGQLLNRAGLKAVTCGNIGNPWIGELDGLGERDWVVLEISSFQLHYCEKLHPFIGILLNLGENHLNWHASMADYVEAKLRLFRNQKKTDWALFGEKDRAYFPADYSFQGEIVAFEEKPEEPVQLAVLKKVAALLGISAPLVEEVLNDFQGLEHRLEKFYSADGITFINDSKCTTPLALKWALEKFEDKRILLIAGGQAKSRNFEMLGPLLDKKVKKVILFGQDAELLKAAWQTNCECQRVKDLEAAVSLSRKEAVQGDFVLLSPGCASFDMFRSYEDRGTQFKEIVLARLKTSPMENHV